MRARRRVSAQKVIGDRQRFSVCKNQSQRGRRFGRAHGIGNRKKERERIKSSERKRERKGGRNL